MKVIAVDDEELAKIRLTRSLLEVFEDAEITGFQNATACMEYVKEMAARGQMLEYAFLDIQMASISGVELAKKIKDYFPKVRILFVTAYNNYAQEAFKIQAKGYILKPVSKELIEEALDDMCIDWRKELQGTSEKRLFVHTFGKFNISVSGKPLVFTRKKCKELLAFLIDNEGEEVCNDRIIDAILESDGGQIQKRNYLKKIRSEMLKTLRDVGMEEVVIKVKNGMAVNTELIDCDSYLFQMGDVAAINSYQGIYMEEYSWAEFTTARLTARREKQQNR